MKIYHRPFELYNDDFEKMWHFLQYDYVQKQDGFIWHIGRLGDWKYGLWNEKKYIPTFFREHAQLWFDSFGQLLGFAINEDGGSTFFIFTLDGYGPLYGEILDWTLRHWGLRGEVLQTEVHEYQHEALAQLEQCGFRSLGPIATTRTYDLREKLDEAVILPPGYRIVHMGENQDQRSKALLYADGFQHTTPFNEFELLRGEYSHENPAYDPRLDFSVLNAEGMHVATVVGFSDPANKAAEVEKICSHSRYRRLGLAEAVIRACFHQLARRGFEKAYIQGYSGEANGLYEKLGPCKRKQWFLYQWRNTA